MEGDGIASPITDGSSSSASSPSDSPVIVVRGGSAAIAKAAGGGGGSSETSSDTESWTILDEEDEKEREEEEEEEEEAADEVKEEDAGGSVVPPPEGQQHLTGLVSNESDSDIETLERGFFGGVLANLKPALAIFSSHAAAAEKGGGSESLSSIVSDGISISEDLSEESLRYLWHTDAAMSESFPDSESTLSLASPTEIDRDSLISSEEGGEEQSDEEDGDDESELDEDDIEILTPKINDITSQSYPTEELPEDFAEAMIERGRTYSHHRNQDVNVVLSGVLIIVVAMVLGLGVGHFLGWSERLELQEIYAEVREEKMEELEENLVSCMTGEEGKGGDDQDLDDRVIQQLWVENRDLKEQLVVLKSAQERDDSSRRIENELNVILRDRINDLLTANADLEKEVARLRYSHSAMVDVERSKEKLEETRTHLQETRKSLNEIAHENDQLKMAIARARYSTPSMPIAERVRMNDLQTENDELKHEIRKFRYVRTPPELSRSILDHPAPTFNITRLWNTRPALRFPQYGKLALTNSVLDPAPIDKVVADNDDDDDEGFVDLDTDSDSAEDEEEDSYDEVASTEEEEDQPTLKKDEPRSSPEKEPPPIDETSSAPTVPEHNKKQQEQDNARAGKGEEKKAKKSFASLFEKLSGLVINSTSSLLNKSTSLLDMSAVSRAIDKVNKKAQKILKKDVLTEENLKKVSDFAAGAEEVLIGKWNEVQRLAESERFREHVKASKVAVDKLGKTLVATLHNIKDSLKKDNLDESWSKIHGFMQSKWQSVLGKFQNTVDRKREKEMKKEEDEEEEEVVTTEPQVVREEMREQRPSYTRWSYRQMEPAGQVNDTNWMFDRAQEREQSRKASKRSDWMFNRAKDREQFHEMGKADWHTKRLFNKKCSEDEDGEEHCEDIGMLNPAEINRVVSNNNRKTKGDTGDDEDNVDEDDDEDVIFNPNYFTDGGYDADEDRFVSKKKHRPIHFGFFEEEDDEDDEEEDEDEDLLHGFLHRKAREIHNHFGHHRGSRFGRGAPEGEKRHHHHHHDRRWGGKHERKRGSHFHHRNQRKNDRNNKHSFSFETEL